MLEVSGLCKTFGGVVATREVSLTVAAGEVHALIGPNGAGKTTLVSQLTGALKPDRGVIRLEGRDVSRYGVDRRARLGMARSFQITSVVDELSVLQNVMLAIQALQGHSYRFWTPVSRDALLTEPAMRALSRIGLDARSGSAAADLSHGERRQLEVTMAMAMAPKLLLLDEPMAGMGREETSRMVAFLGAIKGGPGMLLVEHDMDAVFALADRITVLVDGAVIASGTPAAIRDNEEVRAAYLGDE